MHRRQRLLTGLVVAAFTALTMVGSLQAQQGGHRLSLAECLRMALANNLDLVSARLGPEISEQDVTAADAAFALTMDKCLRVADAVGLKFGDAVAATAT